MATNLTGAMLVVSCPAWAEGEGGAGNGHLRVELAVSMTAEQLRKTLNLFVSCDADECIRALHAETVSTDA